MMSRAKGITPPCACRAPPSGAGAKTILRRGAESEAAGAGREVEAAGAGREVEAAGAGRELEAAGGGL